MIPWKPTIDYKCCACIKCIEWESDTFPITEALPRFVHEIETFDLQIGYPAKSRGPFAIRILILSQSKNYIKTYVLQVNNILTVRPLEKR